MKQNTDKLFFTHPLVFMKIEFPEHERSRTRTRKKLLRDTKVCMLVKSWHLFDQFSVFMPFNEYYFIQ